jgi:glycosyltransferase involved in cell wall biosynthesis
MSKNPLVSIILPLYNKRSYVRRAVQSIQDQTYGNWELIVVNDGSSDGSENEVPTSDKRIRLFHQKNSGPGAARNRGIREAQGQLVTFLDADDHYYPQKLEKETGLLAGTSEADWMLSAKHYKINNEIRLQKICDINGKEISKSPIVIKDAVQQLSINWHINCLCIKRNLLSLLKGFRESMRCYEVTDFFYRCALIRPTVVIYPLPLSRQVDVPMSTFKDSDHRIEGLRRLGENLFNLSHEHPNYSSRLLAVSRDIMLNYSGKLILSGEKIKSRQFLVDHFTYKRNLKWWKMFFASWFPDSVIKLIYADRWGFTCV